MPETPASTPPATSSADEEMAKKLMEELKMNGIDIDAMQQGADKALAEPASPKAEAAAPPPAPPPPPPPPKTTTSVPPSPPKPKIALPKFSLPWKKKPASQDKTLEAIDTTEALIDYLRHRHDYLIIRVKKSTALIFGACSLILIGSILALLMFS